MVYEMLRFVIAIDCESMSFKKRGRQKESRRRPQKEETDNTQEAPCLLEDKFVVSTCVV